LRESIETVQTSDFLHNLHDLVDGLDRSWLENPNIVAGAPEFDVVVSHEQFNQFNELEGHATGLHDQLKRLLSAITALHETVISESGAKFIAYLQIAKTRRKGA
jgi:hypothetical protein